MNIQQQKQSSLFVASLLAAATLLIVGPAATDGQFLEPQSHLGRLVQSIASPLVLGQASSFRQAASEAAAAGPEPIVGYYPGLDQDQPESALTSEIDPQAHQDHFPARQHHWQQQQRQQQQQPMRVSASRPSNSVEEQYYRRQNYYNQQQQREAAAAAAAAAATATPLQRAPSQQVRGIPQQYYRSNPSSSVSNYDDDDDRADADESPVGRSRVVDQPRGSSSYRNKQREQPSYAPEYQMGAYLGPTVDDKEINGAFNDDRDDIDDDSPASYDASAGQARRPAQRNAGYSREASQLQSAYRQPMPIFVRGSNVNQAEAIVQPLRVASSSSASPGSSSSNDGGEDDDDEE